MDDTTTTTTTTNVGWPSAKQDPQPVPLLLPATTTCYFLSLISAPATHPYHLKFIDLCSRYLRLSQFSSLHKRLDPSSGALQYVASTRSRTLPGGIADLRSVKLHWCIDVHRGMDPRDRNCTGRVVCEHQVRSPLPKSLTAVVTLLSDCISSVAQSEIVGALNGL